MALKKVKELPSGVQGEYWKIIEAKADRVKNMLSVKIALFKNQLSAQEGKQSLGIVHYFSQPCTKSQLEENLISLGYSIIKSQCAGAAPSIVSGKILAYNDLKGAVDT